MNFPYRFSALRPDSPAARPPGTETWRIRLGKTPVTEVATIVATLMAIAGLFGYVVLAPLEPKFATLPWVGRFVRLGVGIGLVALSGVRIEREFDRWTSREAGWSLDYRGGLEEAFGYAVVPALVVAVAYVMGWPQVGIRSAIVAGGLFLVGFVLNSKLVRTTLDVAPSPSESENRDGGEGF